MVVMATVRSFLFGVIAGTALLFLAQSASAEDLYNASSLFIRGTTKDVVSTRALADKGDADAQFNLGSIYLTGVGAPPDYSEAFIWFQKSADQGNESSQYNLGSMYYTGTATDRDFSKAYLWYSLAAVNGNQFAIDARDAVAKEITVDELSKAQGSALSWLIEHPMRKSATTETANTTKVATEVQSTPTAPIAEAKPPFVRGNNLLLATRYPKAAGGDAQAQWNVGQVYYTGAGAPRSYAKALNWFTRYAEQGYIPALFSLGEIYLSAKGVHRNYIEAYKWYSLVKSTDSDWAASASTKLDYIESQLNSTQLADAQKRAQDWLLLHP